MQTTGAGPRRDGVGRHVGRAAAAAGSAGRDGNAMCAWAMRRNAIRSPRAVAYRPRPRRHPLDVIAIRLRSA